MDAYFTNHHNPEQAVHPRTFSLHIRSHKRTHSRKDDPSAVRVAQRSTGPRRLPALSSSGLPRAAVNSREFPGLARPIPDPDAFGHTLLVVGSISCSGNIFFNATRRVRLRLSLSMRACGKTPGYMPIVPKACKVQRRAHSPFWSSLVAFRTATLRTTTDEATTTHGAQHLFPRGNRKKKSPAIEATHHVGEAAACTNPQSLITYSLQPLSGPQPLSDRDNAP